MFLSFTEESSANLTLGDPEPSKPRLLTDKHFGIRLTQS